MKAGTYISKAATYYYYYKNIHFLKRIQYNDISKQIAFSNICQLFTACFDQ